jgi:hypothetical protein
MAKVLEVHPGGSNPVRDTNSPAYGYHFLRWLTR